MDKQDIENIIAPRLIEKDYILIDLKVGSGNSISVEIDSDKGVTIDDCVEFSRLIEHSLDRDKEDFDLMVSSPGLSEPLRIPWQLKKFQGQEVDVLVYDGKKLSGELLESDEEGFKIKEIKHERVEGKKKKQEVEYLHAFAYKVVKTVKVKISFK